MVDHDEMRAFRLAPGAKDEALSTLVEDTRAGIAGSFLFGNLPPVPFFTTSEAHLSPIASGGTGQPGQDLGFQARFILIEGGLAFPREPAA